jgi:site-specific recombinase XerD
MSLRKRGGNWHYRFKYKGREYTGNTDLAATPQNKTEALLIKAEALKTLKSGRPLARSIDIDVVCFQEAAEKFLVSAAVTYRAHPNSYKRIRTSLSSARVYFRKTPVNAIDAGKLEAYKTWRANEHEVRDVTIRHDLHALSKFFQYAIRHHWTFTNPVAEIEIPSDADAERIHVLTELEEADYFRRAASFLDLHDVGRLMINQGMRPEEITTLAKKHIHLEAGKIHITRGKSRAAKRLLDMTTESRQILELRMAGSSPWIFPSSRKRGSHIGRINSAHDRLVASARKEGVTIDFVPYDFRHTFATRMAESGVDLPTLAALLGHDGIRCVQKYVHPTAEHKKKAMMLFDRAIQTRKRQDLGAPSSLQPGVGHGTPSIVQ